MWKIVFLPLIWFMARVTLESQPPLFQGTGFAFFDGLVLMIGLLGLAMLITDVLTEIRI